MLRSLSLLFTLGTLLLIGAAHVGAQQVRPSTRRPTPKKPRAGQPVPGTAKRSSSTTKASGASNTSAASTTPADSTPRNNSDTPNTVNSNGSIGSQESADGQGQGAYAAPGMLVKPADSKHVGSYDGKAAKAPRTTKGGSTLKPGGKE